MLGTPCRGAQAVHSLPGQRWRGKAKGRVGLILVLFVGEGSVA